MVNGKGALGRNTFGGGGLGTHGQSRGPLLHTGALGNVDPGFTDLLIVQMKQKSIYICSVFWFLNLCNGF